MYLSFYIIIIIFPNISKYQKKTFEVIQLMLVKTKTTNSEMKA